MRYFARQRLTKARRSALFNLQLFSLEIESVQEARAAPGEEFVVSTDVCLSTGLCEFRVDDSSVAPGSDADIAAPLQGVAPGTLPCAANSEPCEVPHAPTTNASLPTGNAAKLAGMMAQHASMVALPPGDVCGMVACRCESGGALNSSPGAAFVSATFGEPPHALRDSPSSASPGGSTMPLAGAALPNSSRFSTWLGCEVGFVGSMDVAVQGDLSWGRD